MTFRQPSSRPRWALSFLAAIVAVLTIIGLAGTASAATTGTAETRVGASTEPAAVAVGPPEHITAGQRLGEAPDRVVTVVATGVAANAVPPRFITTGAGVTIDRASVAARVAQTQGRHVAGHANYGGRGYFNSLDDAQSVLDDFHSGAAQVLGVKRNGDIVVRSPNVTGFNHNPGAGFPNQPTNVFFIKGTSSPSVVPYNPAWTP